MFIFCRLVGYPVFLTDVFLLKDRFPSSWNIRQGGISICCRGREIMYCYAERSQFFAFNYNAGPLYHWRGEKLFGSFGIRGYGIREITTQKPVATIEGHFGLVPVFSKWISMGLSLWFVRYRKWTQNSGGAHAVSITYPFYGVDLENEIWSGLSVFILRNASVFRYLNILLSTLFLKVIFPLTLCARK